MLILILFIIIISIMLSTNMSVLIEGGGGEISFTSENITRLIPKGATIALDSEWSTFNPTGQPINIDRCKAYASWKKEGSKKHFQYKKQWPKTIPLSSSDTKTRQLVCIISIALSEENVIVFRAFGSGLPYDKQNLDNAIETLKNLNLTIYVFGGYIEKQLLKGYEVIELQPLIEGNQQGLQTTIKEKFGIDLSKDNQCSNWFSTPLTSDQYDYALKDALWIYRLIKKN